MSFDGARLTVAPAPAVGDDTCSVLADQLGLAPHRVNPRYLHDVDEAVRGGYGQRFTDARLLEMVPQREGAQPGKPVLIIRLTRPAYA
jgi:hypothetical protein